MKLNLILKKLRLSIKLKYFNFIKQCLPRRNHKNYNPSIISSVLLIRNDKLGDMVVSTPLINYLYHSGYEVYVSSLKSSLNIIKYSPYVKGIVYYDDSSWGKFFASLRAARQQKFDLVIDLRLRQHIDIKHLIFCSLMKTKNLLGFNKSSVKSYNLSIAFYEQDVHVTEQFKKILSYLNIEFQPCNYEIFVSSAIEEYGKQYINKLKQKNNKIIVFNPFGGSISRVLSNLQIESICHELLDYYPDSTVVIIGDTKALETLDIYSSVIIKFNSINILDIVPIIKYSDMVISVDTSIVHIASAFDKKTIALYQEDSESEDFSLLSEKKRLKIKYNQFKFKLYDEFFDGCYLRDSNIKYEHSKNRTLWGPNNINAKQIIFKCKNLNEIEMNFLIHKIKDALD